MFDTASTTPGENRYEHGAITCYAADSLYEISFARASHRDAT